MTKAFKIFLDIHYEDKHDKNGMFDIVTSCSIFDKYIFSENIFYCLVIKISKAALNRQDSMTDTKHK